MYIFNGTKSVQQYESIYTHDMSRLVLHPGCLFSVDVFPPITTLWSVLKYWHFFQRTVSMVGSTMWIWLIWRTGSDSVDPVPNGKTATRVFLNMTNHGYFAMMQSSKKCQAHWEQTMNGFIYLGAQDFLQQYRTMSIRRPLGFAVGQSHKRKQIFDRWSCKTCCLLCLGSLQTVLTG